MVKGQGVVYINYVDDKISSGMNGHAVNIFFDVYDFDIDKRSKSAYMYLMRVMLNLLLSDALE